MPAARRQDGPLQSPRLHRYSASKIAQALIAVGRGESYTRASRTLRREHGRSRRSSRRGRYYPSDASLVMDWVEVFAPVLEHAAAEDLTRGQPLRPGAHQRRAGRRPALSYPRLEVARRRGP